MEDSPLERLRAVVAQLRAPGGCPWDREQTHAGLRTALLEETYEVLAAIEADDDPNLREELGDLLLHVVLHSQIASERGAFDFDAVAREIGEKMVRRHPHVFGGDQLADTAAVLVRWDEIKRREKAGRGGEVEPSRMDGLPTMLPALMRAQKAQEKAAKVGFDWRAADEVLAKVREEITEIEETPPGASEAVAEEIGDLLFSAVNLARWHKLDAETTLRLATDKFVRRFQHVESALRTRGQSWDAATFEELDALWEKAKSAAPTR